MPSLTVKLGRLEVSYDGDQKFIEKGLGEFIENLLQKAGPSSNSGAVADVGGGAAAVGDEGLGHTTSMIAQIAGGGTGPDLAQAAIAYLTLVKGKDKLTRADILAEMKGATSFYKETFGGGNLSKTLSTMVKNKRLNPISDGIYSMPHSLRVEFSSKLKND